MYEVKVKPQIVVEKMKEFRPKIAKKYFASATQTPPPPPIGGGNGDPFKNNNNFNKFIKFTKTKQNISNDIPQKLSENKLAVKLNNFKDVLKKDNIPKDVAEKLNKFLANIKKPQNIFNNFNKIIKK